MYMCICFYIYIYMCIHICVVACGKNGSGLHGSQYTISYYLRGQFTGIYIYMYKYVCIYIYVLCMYIFIYIYTFSSLKFSKNIHYIFCILHYALRSICCVLYKNGSTLLAQKNCIMYYALCIKSSLYIAWNIRFMPAHL